MTDLDKAVERLTKFTTDWPAWKYTDDVNDAVKLILTALSAQSSELAKVREALLTARDYVQDAAEGRAWTASQVAECLRGNRPDNSMAAADLVRINQALGETK